jgi:hypothetical protein
MEAQAMFPLIRPSAQARYVDGGCVYCPLRERDVEVDFCAGCEWMTAIDLQAELPFVRCRPGPVLRLPA